MIYIGIDVAKDKHDCHIFSAEGEILQDNFRFSNSLSGFNSFIDLIKSFSQNFSEVKVGLESTGHYHKNLTSFFLKNNIPFVVFNPLSVNRFRKSQTLRSTKTDKSDARYIAEMTKYAPESYLNISYHIEELKSLTRNRYRTIKALQPLKNRYRRSLQLVFPEFEKIFDVHVTSSLLLLEKYPGPSSICGARKSTLEKFLKDISHGRVTHKLESLLIAAKDSIGSSNKGDIFELQQNCFRIIFLENQIQSINEQISKIMSEIKSPITSIPGIGDILGATILAEIGNIDNFSSPEQLQAFAGIDPQIYESGQYVAKVTPMSKKGSACLRNALYLSTNSAFTKGGFMHTYVNRKRAQGKHFYTAMSHGMKKMVRIIFSVLKNNKPFVEPVI